MKANLYIYMNYKQYLVDQLTERGKTERGPRARLAEFAGCHLAYLSQVLNGKAHLSPEQAEKCSRFFSHTKVECAFFLNLVLLARAGTEHLRQFYLRQIREISDARKLIKNRLDLKKNLPSEAQAIYYSSWDYLAIHIAVSIPKFQTKQALADCLGLSLERAGEVLEFLVQFGLVKNAHGRYLLGDSGFHLGMGSPFLAKHHANWRIQSLRALDTHKPEDIHYSSVISCNHSDIPKIREILLNAIENIREIVKQSKDEDSLISYCVDLFPVNKK